MKLQTYFAEKASPRLYKSQFRFRLEKALKRCEMYPLDSLDFILADIEKPKNYIRAAQACTTDLTGRYLDFLSMAAKVMPECVNAKRLDDLYSRISECAGGTYGNFEGGYKIGRMESAIANYYMYSNNPKAYDYLKKVSDTVADKPVDYSGMFESWGYYEAAANIYEVTHNRNFIASPDSVQMPDSLQSAHSHGTLYSMRGLQMMSMFSGERAFADKIEPYRQEIAEKYEHADGCIPEYFPQSMLNEGCSISDWIMTNLNTGLVYGDDAAYAKAENSMFNALFFNQTLFGGFGHRMIGPNGYGSGDFIEAWWCCLENAGRSLVEMANNTVTRRDDGYHVNFLIPGMYSFDNGVTIEIRTGYPTKADTVITANRDVALKIRIPDCIIKPATEKETNFDGSVTYRISGRIGYNVTYSALDEAYCLRYGNLVMAPNVARLRPKDSFRKNALLRGIFTDVDWYGEGGIADIDNKRPKLLLPEADEDGLIPLTFGGYNCWTYFDEGTLNQDGLDPISCHVEMEYSNGSKCKMRFYPLCYASRAVVCGEWNYIFDI